MAVTLLRFRGGKTKQKYSNNKAICKGTSNICSIV